MVLQLPVKSIQEMKITMKGVTTDDMFEMLYAQ